MTRKLLTGLFLIGAVTAAQGQVVRASVAGSGGTDPLEIQPASKLWVEGGSTVRGYRCEAETVDGRIALKRPLEANSPEQLAAAAAGVSVDVQVAGLGCGNGKMDEHMRKALKADKHGAIRFRSTSHELLPGGSGSRLKVEGLLTIAGQERPITLEAEAVQEADGALRIRGEEPLRMTEYGVKPPTLMLGTLKVHDEVKVGFDLVIEP